MDKPLLICGYSEGEFFSFFHVLFFWWSSSFDGFINLQELRFSFITDGQSLDFYGFGAIVFNSC